MLDTNIDGKVQRLQAMLYAKASNEPETRFKRLYKYLTRREWVETALAQVLRNRGSRTAGIDGKARDSYLDEDKRSRLVNSILSELTAQVYRPQPVRRVYIPKANGKKRPLGIPTIKDRVVQMMVKLLLEPVYEATFLPCSYGFRPHRCTWDALAEVHHYLQLHCHYHTIIEGDIDNCFGTIDHGVLMHQLRRRVLDERLLTLVWHMLRAGVMEDLQHFETTEGTPQGGIVSPLLANVYLHRLDEWMHQRFHAMPRQERYRRRRGGELVAVRYIRYADDFIVMLREGERAEELKRELTDFTCQELKMSLSAEKTHITQAEQGFDFLGVRTFVAPRRSNPRQLRTYHVPAKKSVQSYRQRIRELTHRYWDYLPAGERIRTITWVIAGWANYHRWGNAKDTFAALCHWTNKKVHVMLRRYTPVGKCETYRMYFRPVSECNNLQRWKKYTRWLTPSVEIPGGVRLGILPMSVISTAVYWRYRGAKIPSAFGLLDAEPIGRERDAAFYTDLEVLRMADINPAARGHSEKYNLTYFHNRKQALHRDRYTCTVCGYQSQRRQGDVNDLEVHHVDPVGGNDLDNLRTVCLSCHRRLTRDQIG